ncbi:hypothetical protein AB0875_17205 [Micromonospora gifhornensis]|uniref:hypothetical protein n=1 Tax=Micromonospora gifhornensis TaxID=84594 RepID=UPI003455D8D6
MRINSRALDYFHPKPWDVIADQIGRYTAHHSPFMAEIVDSIRACGAAGRLAGFMSMHDLAVTPVPVPSQGPIEVVWVRPQPHSGAPEEREVLIEHYAPTGHDDRIWRPGTEAVVLFWRFMIEKFGIEPNRADNRDGASAS